MHICIYTYLYIYIRIYIHIYIYVPPLAFESRGSLEHQAWPGPFEGKSCCNPYPPGSAARPAHIVLGTVWAGSLPPSSLHSLHFPVLYQSPSSSSRSSRLPSTTPSSPCEPALCSLLPLIRSLYSPSFIAHGQPFSPRLVRHRPHLPHTGGDDWQSQTMKQKKYIVYI